MKRTLIIIAALTVLIQTGLAQANDRHADATKPKGAHPHGQLENKAPVKLQPGDLLFYRDTDGMGAAVNESTGQYTHVALVAEVGDTVWLIDATQRYGVSRRPFLRHADGAKPYPDVFRLTVPFDTSAVVARALSFVGQPYDNAFLPDNGALYCSELIQACFCRSDGSPLFESRPMNWRNAKGQLPRYWRRHFRKLKTPVPEGVPGTNPTDMSRSPLLQKL